MSRSTVIAGMKQVASGPNRSDRVRAHGAGPKTLADTQPGLLEALDKLVNPETQGNPMSLLRWTSKSTAKLARDLVRQGFEVSDDTVGRILKRRTCQVHRRGGGVPGHVGTGGDPPAEWSL